MEFMKKITTDYKTLLSLLLKCHLPLNDHCLGDLNTDRWQ